MNRPFARRRPAAFTLIELLTVIAVIGILAAIIIATVGRTRLTALQSRSLANLRQIGSAVQLHAADNRNQLPVWHNYSEGKYWWEVLQPYVGADPEIYHSPAHIEFDASTRDRLAETISYGWNYAVLGRHIGDPGKEGDHRLDITSYPTPSRTLVAADGSREASWGFIAADKAPDPDRYRGRIPSLFLDGHTEARPYAEFTQIDPWFNPVKVLPPNK